MQDALIQLQTQGFAIIPAIYDAAEIQRLTATIAALPLDNCYGERAFLLRHPSISAQLMTPRFQALLASVGQTQQRLIKSIYFDKPPKANWSVPWHQDTTIYVQAKRPTPGFKHWRVKDHHVAVQPPLSLLQSIVTTRIHLDACHAQNGALRVMAGSHQQGILNDNQRRQAKGEIVCQAPAGSVLLMKPLCLHASQRGENQQRRRVIHLEWCEQTLPNALQWYETLKEPAL